MHSSHNQSIEYKGEGDLLFIQCLDNLILEDGADIFYGHIECFRRKLGKAFMNYDRRTQVGST